MELEQENRSLREKIDDLYYLNQKLDEALRAANEQTALKIEQQQQQIESTNVGDSTMNKMSGG